MDPREKEAREKYIQETANDADVHCNRFPSWGELPEHVRLARIEEISMIDPYEKYRANLVNYYTALGTSLRPASPLDYQDKRIIEGCLAFADNLPNTQHAQKYTGFGWDD